MKMSNKLRAQLMRSLQCLDEALAELNKPGTLGVAREIAPERALGSSYDLRNPKCMETCNGLALHVEINSVVGSKVVMAWTAKSILESLIKD